MADKQLKPPASLQPTRRALKNNFVIYHFR